MSGKTALGGRDLPEEQQAALRRAIRLEWVTLAVLAVTVAAVYSVSGQSQAMKAAWIEDSLSFLPPIAFLVAVRVSRIPPSARFPYGHHRAVDIGHLVAGVSLLVMGVFLIVDSGTGLITGERPPLGVVEIGGHVIWSGWLMVVVMGLSVIGPFILGRMKLAPAEALHDKVLYADAAMNRADWKTGLATIVGVFGIGLGLWWADAVAALVVSVSIISDGWSNLRGAIEGLADARPTRFDGTDPHPLVYEIDELLAEVDWSVDRGARVRDEGHVFHVEAFLVPADGREVTVEALSDVRRRLARLSWKIEDVVVTVVPEVLDSHRPC
ncbi:cation diffusion facilitator family transporter [Dietzia cinnamea]|uniref:cation diffusion facilitator family transporter n=1 Tax=Dietzia cinnamea TaxID=321318 RepID=UPI0021A4CAA0|nr:cation diffusion facilitator family transporter [Dietzia cinnamea]MCT2030002.1 cation diffusion facilitator family transporter [Dietzia cinnamea]